MGSQEKFISNAGPGDPEPALPLPGSGNGASREVGLSQHNPFSHTTADPESCCLPSPPSLTGVLSTPKAVPSHRPEPTPSISTKCNLTSLLRTTPMMSPPAQGSPLPGELNSQVPVSPQAQVLSFTHLPRLSPLFIRLPEQTGPSTCRSSGPQGILLFSWLNPATDLKSHKCRENTYLVSLAT